MARKIGERLRELRKIVRLHTNWFTVALLGTESVSDEELQELKEYDKLPLDDSLDLAQKSYILGRLQATLKSTEYKTLSYEEVEDVVKKATFTSLEEYAVAHAKMHAADGIKRLAADVADGAFDRLKGAVREAVNEASVRGIIQDATAMALTEKQPYQKLASTLAQDLKSETGRDWKRVAATEMHRSKQIGTAQAIVNKIGPYKHSEGPDSMVRIIPNTDTCVDCADKYLDDEGKPKAFHLSEILQAGSNADDGVKHTRKDGKHSHWKTTLPPLHPGCGCRIAYAPGGLLSKAVNPTAGTVTAPSPPSIPGVPAPGNEAGPGRPAVDPLGKTELGSGSKKEMVDCPFGGGDECKKHGGHGGATHEADGGEMKAHQEHLEGGAEPTDPEAARQMMARERAGASAYDKYPPSAQHVLKDIGQGEIVEVKNTKEGMDDKDVLQARAEGITGLADSFKVRIKDNGNAMMKPGAVRSNSGELAGGDLGQCPAGQFHNHEASAYDYSMLLGSTESIPETTTRTHEGTAMSMQAWAEDFKPMGVSLHKSGAMEKYGNNTYKAVLNSAPADKKDALKRKLDEIICMSAASNGGDDHADNIMVSEDFSDVRKIDSGASFGNSMFGSKNKLLVEAAKASSDGMFHMPDHVVQRMSTMSLGDMKKGLPKLQDWQVGQQFMRQQYMLFLQKNDGGLHPDKFLPTWADKDEPSGAFISIGGREMWGGNSAEKQMEAFRSRETARQLPHQMFDSFCKMWMNDTAKDDNHQHNAAAKELQELGIFMPPTYKKEDGTPEYTMKDPALVRRQGGHKAYEDSIVGRYPPHRLLMTQLHSKPSTADIQAALKEDQEKRAKPPGSVHEDSTVVDTPVKKSLHLYLDLTKSW